MDDKIGMRRGLTSYGDEDFSLYLRTAFIKAMGYTDEALNLPVIGIVNTFSGFNPCHGNVPQIIEAVKRGVMLARGLPVEFPTISLHESFSYPTSMYLRNLMSMDTEEMLRALPMDACVLIGGCDKTVPAQLMAAASADVPAISLVTGPMLSSSHRGERIGACTDCRRFWGEYRGGSIKEDELKEVTGQLVPSVGTCGVMGTASTMACMAEAMGMMLPGGATIPAVLSERLRHSEESGAHAVKLSKMKLKPSEIMTPAALKNALRVLLAVGGSTNCLVHLAAIAGRLGVQLDMDAFNTLGAETPVLVDLKPSGKYYMDDLYRAGGMAVVLRELKPLLNLDCMTITGRTLGEEIEASPKPFAQDVVRTIANPIHFGGSLVSLKGNLAGNGAIIKQSACSPDLLKHSGRAVVFDSLNDLADRIDTITDISKEDVLVLRNAGPKGAPGMPEAGYIPIPKVLAKQGVTDMVRISDCRMSGTAFGTIVLHAEPEAAVGGPLALVENDDIITLDVANRTLTIDVDAEELERRRAAWVPAPPVEGERGYRKLFVEHVNQAGQGVDFDFLTNRPFTAKTP
ncbi:MAG TPA: dihydroxy-acid dehydratase [Gammaproteobacteria bacterium]|jgi:dihydroxy-acid dehydratase|nr:IlvD/Edd family dehydratase [Gammaproteobacteria bacterium]HAT26693.1 dihydroxy-acid dehydratase [Gammaproteobacteria bacterium]|tara:strand:- start:210 stop:1925 length:1716 start_codon:yes stop_codon:yes gene_type:complete